MVLVELGDEAVLAEDLFVVGFGDPYKVVEFGLDLGVPVFVIVQQLRVQVVAEQGATGGPDIARLTDLDGEDVAASFVAVQGFHKIIICPKVRILIYAVSAEGLTRVLAFMVRPAVDLIDSSLHRVNG